MEESTAVRILVAGSRSWTDRDTIQNALVEQLHLVPFDNPVVLVHGHCQVNGAPAGADRIAEEIWRGWIKSWKYLGGGFIDPERHPVSGHPDSLARVEHMVSLGADVCVSFCVDYTSEDAHCARVARAVGIRTVDYGISTRVEDRPVVQPYLQVA